MSPALAAWLGAVLPQTVDEFRAMKRGPYILIRDTATAMAWFWPLAPGTVLTIRSS